MATASGRDPEADHGMRAEGCEFLGEHGLVCATETLKTGSEQLEKRRQSTATPLRAGPSGTA